MKWQQEFTIQQAGRHTAIIGALTNTFLATIKLTGGFLSGSTALIADGIHSLADLVTDFIAFFAVHLGHAEADDSHPYGHGKFESVGTIILSGFLAATALGIGYESIERYLEGKMAFIGPLALFVALTSVIANELLFKYTEKIGRKVNSQAIIANAWHHRADSLSSIAVMFGMALSLAISPLFDVLAALVVSALLIKMAISMGRGAFDELVDAAIDEATQNKILKAITDIEGVRDAHDFRARSLGGRVFIDAHVGVDPYISVSEGHAIAEQAERAVLALEHTADAVIHIDPFDGGKGPFPKNLSRKETEKAVNEALKEVYPEAVFESIHMHILRTGMMLDVYLSGLNQSDLSQSKQALTDKIQKSCNRLDHIRYFIKSY